MLITAALSAPLLSTNPGHTSDRNIICKNTALRASSLIDKIELDESDLAVNNINIAAYPSRGRLMIYYRVALQENQSATWRWKSGLLNSLHGVLGLLKLYSSIPREHIRVFLSTSPDQMDEMLSRANQGLLSTAITVDQLWDKHCMSWIEVSRLEVELGAGGDHDQPYTWDLPLSSSHVLAWTKLLARREHGELEP
jgi:hypothetical protein